MKNRKGQAGVCYIVAGIYVLFTGSLMIMSLFVHCQTNIYDYGHTKSLERHTPFLYCTMTALCIGALAGVSALWRRFIALTKSDWERLSRMVFWGCGVVLTVACAVWIFFYDSAPIYDQKEVLAEARRIAGFLDEPYNTAYFSYFQRNRGITLLAAVVIRIFGDHMYALRILNLLAVLVIYGSVCKAAALIYRNPVVTAFTSVLLMLFYPPVIYTSFLYGTLLSVACLSVALCEAIQFGDTGRRRYVVWMICAFTLGILAHQSVAVGLIAAMLYLLVKGGKEKLAGNFIVLAAAVVAVVLSLKLVNTAYDRVTGTIPENEAVPASCTVYMGITATEGGGGPGSQDGSYTDLFNENDRDAAAANRDALRRIGRAVREYAVGERSLSFFLEKIQYQWLDPTFGARKIIVMNNTWDGNVPNSEAFTAFYDSFVRNAAFKLSIVFMLLVYLGAFLTGILTWKQVGACPAGSLIQLYVIGGFAFQMMWESLSRYCLGYFLWLIPGAAYGICWFCGGRRRRVTGDE